MYANAVPVAPVPPGGSARQKGPLDRLLGIFAEINGGEAGTALLLMLNVFLLLAAYYLLKTIREPLILSVPHGAEVKSYSAAATAGLLMLIVPFYSAVASRVSRVSIDRTARSASDDADVNFVERHQQPFPPPQVAVCRCFIPS